MEEKIFTPEQVAGILQVHPCTVLKFIRQGKLKAVKLGRVYRIKHMDVEAFLEAQTLGWKKNTEGQPQGSKKSSKKDKEEVKEIRTETVEEATPDTETLKTEEEHKEPDHYILG